ncbi:MAG: SpoIVB peptidase [Syntrophomonadaceae bacterium]|nr:SpoIVB peptidase [Syntrophomonadaceae bacterium]
MPKIRPLIGIVLSILFVALCLNPQVKTIILLPASQIMVVGEANLININLPAKIQNNIEMKVTGPAHSVFAAQEDPEVTITRQSNGYEIMALKPGKVNVMLNLWGYIPIKSMQIEAVPPRRVVVGGHSIGIFLHSRGIMVVGFAPITNTNGDKLYPGREQGVEIGDLIMAVDSQPVSTETDLASIIDNKGQTPMQFTINRRGKEIVIPITPVHCAETDRYRIGLYVRDGVVGVGTLTFYDPASRQYAALGHIIVDADTHQGIDVAQGKIVSASIQTVKPGRPGWPGEKIGVFDEKGTINGNIIKNSTFGIFGQLDQEIKNPLEQFNLEVAYAHQVKPGKAQIMTVVNGEDIERFDIEITKVNSLRQNGKDMVIRVTDPRLLSLTGGIIQGMSGSPIIQDDRLVGAVTHVFLNDPQTGYGIYMDNILSEMANLPPAEKKVSTIFAEIDPPSLAAGVTLSCKTPEI